MVNKLVKFGTRDITLPDTPPDLSAFQTSPVQVVREYTPPNWSDRPQLYCLTYRVPQSDTLTLQSAATLPEVVPDESSGYYKSTTNVGLAGFNAETRMVMLVFDALKRAQHSQTAIVTQHPLQVGFNIADHIVKQPFRLTLEVAMSDAVASYSIAGYTPMWKLNPSKSVSAYQQMQALMDNRQVVTVMTRLEQYDNMVLINIEVEDSIRTFFGGLAMSLTFQEVFIADVAISYESARSQTATDTTEGTVQPQPPSKTIIDQHKMPTIPGVSATGGIIPTFDWSTIAQGLKVAGAGLWSSTINSFKSIAAF